MVAIPNWPPWHRPFFRPAWCLEKSRILFLQNFANGGHCRLANSTPRFFRPALRLQKSRNAFLQNFANSGHRELAIMAPRVFRPHWRLEKRWNLFVHNFANSLHIILAIMTSCFSSSRLALIFPILREWWSSGIGCHYTAFFKFSLAVSYFSGFEVMTPRICYDNT